MAFDRGFRERRDKASLIQSQMNAQLLTFFFFLNQNLKIGLKAAIYNLSGEAGISILITYWINF